MTRLLTGLLLVLLAVPAATAAPSLGFLLPPGGGPLPAPAPTLPEGASPPVRVVIAWEQAEPQPGALDLAPWEGTIDALAGAGYRVVVCLTAGGLPQPGADGTLDRWLAFGRAAVSRFGPRVGTYEIWDGASSLDPRLYAFFLKNTALALRAQARAEGRELRIAQAAAEAAALDAQRALWAEDTAPYIDILPVRVGAGTDVASALRAFTEAAVEHPPAPELWVHLVPGEGDAPWAAAERQLQAIAANADAALALPADEAHVRWAHGIDRLLAAGYAPAPLGEVAIQDLEGGPSGGAVLARLFNEKDFSSVLFYRSDPAAAPGSQAVLVVDAPDVRDARVIDPVSGGEVKTLPSPVAGSTFSRGVRVLSAGWPMALAFTRVVGPDDLQLDAETLDIRQTRGLTAEEIIARHREVQKVQDDAVARWTSQARLEYHFKLAQGGGSVDIAIDSTYFWERGRPIEWEQTAYYVNGNRLTWKSIPELPLVQPDRVATLPLDLTLDRTYAYRLDGDDEVDGRPAYVLSFDPADPAAPLSLYRGRVWIDKQTFVRLKTNVLQTNLEPPVLSNEEVDLHRPVRVGGVDAWLLSRVDGQQLWTVAGRNLVVRREVTFLSYDVNPDPQAFEARRKQAYASGNQMLRETEEGYRYLDRQADGSRTVQATPDTSQIFAAGGAFKDESIDSVAPLAGVSWFDYDWRQKNVQLSALFAGVLGFFNATKPDLFGKRIDLVGEGAIFLIKGDDKLYLGEEEQVGQRVKTRTQFAGVRLGVPAGQFMKVTLVGSLVYRGYFESSDADEWLAANAPGTRFVVPESGLETGVAVQLEWNRRGWTLRGDGGLTRRASWEPWGLQDVATGAFLEPQDVEAAKSYVQWGATLFKEWYLPAFQKLRGELNYLDGSDLDRFSSYQFSYFGDDRLNGFSGSGVRFDRGAMARAGYSFNLFGALRLDLSVDHARTEVEGDPVRRAFTGVGLSGNVVGPWKTVIQAGYGRAVASDIPELKGQQEFLVLVLKLF